MNTSIPDNSSFTIFEPDDVFVDRYYPCAGEADGEWALDKDSALYQASFKQMEMPPEVLGWREWDALDDKQAAEARCRARARTAPRVRRQTRVRARRSPASVRRAASDSGGDDGDGGGDPEPPRPRSHCNLSQVGGAL